MAIRVIDFPFSLKIDDDNLIVYLGKHHLKESEKRVLTTGDNSIYFISYDGVKKYVKDYIKKNLDNNGYKVIFEYNGKKCLLRYNKK
jgi:hypothetical protein